MGPQCPFRRVKDAYSVDETRPRMLAPSAVHIPEHETFMYESTFNTKKKNSGRFSYLTVCSRSRVRLLAIVGVCFSDAGPCRDRLVVIYKRNAGWVR